MSGSPDLRPRRRDGVLAQSAGDETMLLTPDSGEYYTLNDVGGRIWELADGSRTTAEIVEVIAGEYDAPTEVIAADVREILDELRSERLLADAGPPA
jgi:hypothetical protein